MSQFYHNLRIEESDYQLAKLIRFMCAGDGQYPGSQTRINPYGLPAISQASKYLAGEYGLNDYLDAPEWVIAKYLEERHLA